MHVYIYIELTQLPTERVCVRESVCEKKSARDLVVLDPVRGLVNSLGTAHDQAVGNLYTWTYEIYIRIYRYIHRSPYTHIYVMCVIFGQRLRQQPWDGT
jgi:hypothetical protein